MSKAVKPRILITPNGANYDVQLIGNFEQLAALILTAAKRDKEFNRAILVAAITLYPELKHTLIGAFKNLNLDNE